MARLLAELLRVVSGEVLVVELEFKVEVGVEIRPADIVVEEETAGSDVGVEVRFDTTDTAEVRFDTAVGV